MILQNEEKQLRPKRVNLLEEIKSHDKKSLKKVSEKQTSLE